MAGPRVVLDSNVLVAGLRSRTGASFQLLSAAGSGAFEIAVSVPLVLEYEERLGRLIEKGLLNEADSQVVLDYLCSVARRQAIFFLWRPCLPGPDDDMVLELAVAAECRFIATHNVRDFRGCETFGIEAVLPGKFLRSLRRSP